MAGPYSTKVTCINQNPWNSGVQCAFTRALKQSQSCSESIQYFTLTPMSLRSRLILSSHIPLVLPRFLFPVGLPVKILKAFPIGGSPQTCYQQISGISSKENLGQNVDKGQWNIETPNPHKAWNNSPLEKNPTASWDFSIRRQGLITEPRTGLTIYLWFMDVRCRPCTFT